MKAQRFALSTFVTLAAGALLAGCWERPPAQSEQKGYRGTGMVQIDNPRSAAALAEANKAPEPLPPLPPSGTLAKDTFKNVQVLGDLDSSEFTRTMLAITAWVSPEQGCAYCHAPGEDLSSDKLYTKQVARRMLQMTRKVNLEWHAHVGQTGVTCFTCHRGNPVPKHVWHSNAGQDEGKAYAGWRNGQNRPGDTVALASLPVDPFTDYFLGKEPIRVVANQALPTGEGGATIQHTEATYALMAHMSKGLGVNCTYCHNTRSFTGWSESTPQRVTAWHGIQMVRDINGNFIEPLKTVLPAERLGAAGDAPKANCATCHQGVYKPLYAAAMLKDYPALGSVMKTLATASASPAPLGRVLFTVGKTDIDAVGKDAIAAAAKALKDDAALKVALSGFADKTGSPDANLELAKQRAFAVRDALKAAGADEARVELRKPEFVIGGAEAESRRVDIIAVR